MISGDDLFSKSSQFMNKNCNDFKYKRHYNDDCHVNHISLRKESEKVMNFVNTIVGILSMIILTIIFIQIIFSTKKVNDDIVNSNSLQDKLIETIIKMREIDFDKPSKDDLVISWGKTIDKYGKEEQQEPLFKYVNESLFEKPVYKVLIEIYNNSVFKTPVCTKDVAIEGKKKELIDNFINVYTGMPVFKLGYNFLVENNLIKDDYNAFIDELYHFWFGMYSRCHRTHTQGSSGWEHVFSGEWKEDIIDGHHNWIRYYLLQKEGRIKYHGHTKVKGNVTGDIQYTWDGYLKEVGGFFMNTSPIFDFTVFTICSLPQYGNSDCNIKVDGYDIKIVSFHQKCDDGICLSTCYPS